MALKHVPIQQPTLSLNYAAIVHQVEDITPAYFGPGKLCNCDDVHSAAVVELAVYDRLHGGEPPTDLDKLIERRLQGVRDNLVFVLWALYVSHARLGLERPEPNTIGAGSGMKDKMWHAALIDAREGTLPIDGRELEKHLDRRSRED